jgi:hypothetical protein
METRMTTKSKPPAAISAYMASIGKKGGLTGGKAKRRGSAEHYRKVAEARWGAPKPKG